MAFDRRFENYAAHGLAAHSGYPTRQSGALRGSEKNFEKLVPE